ncbi:hypothetical protein R1sor_013854 [Riccia sorocarpa]|uniref:CCHC-type domain-containing protein n=1 Tax=Riccia sorocarpa TaxID=122646 RepID=A0ABD3HBF3_9MARC
MSVAAAVDLNPPIEAELRKELSRKRVNERRLTLVRKSADLEDFIKRRCSSHLVDEMSQRTPYVGRSGGQHESSLAYVSNYTRRGDLFSGGQNHPRDSGNVRIRSNLAFEQSPQRGQPIPKSPRLDPGPSAAVDLHPGNTQLSPAWRQGRRLSEVLAHNQNRADPWSAYRSSTTPLRIPAQHSQLPGNVVDSQYQQNPDPPTQAKLPSSDPGDPPDHEQQLHTVAADANAALQGARWSDVEEEEQAEAHDGNHTGSATEGQEGDHDADMDDQQWKSEVMQEVTEAFRKLPEHTGKRTAKKSSCGTPSTLMRSYESRQKNVDGRTVGDLVLTSGPYYMRRRMIYTTSWEPGYDTSKILAKKMTCWLDLMEVDPMLEMEGHNMLSALGEVLQTAGVTKQGAGKFAHIRGCVLLDMSQPRPTVLVAEMNGETKRFGIKYNMLPDACFNCQERGHFAKN